MNSVVAKRVTFVAFADTHPEAEANPFRLFCYASFLRRVPAF